MHKKYLNSLLMSNLNYRRWFNVPLEGAAYDGSKVRSKGMITGK